MLSIFQIASVPTCQPYRIRAPNLMLFAHGGWSEEWLLDQNVKVDLARRPNLAYLDLFRIGGG
jgi:hypothetical protein